MALPSSPPLSLSQIKAEFGGGNSFSQYYAGGAYVASGTTGVNGAVPSGPPMAMSKFLGTSNFLQQITMNVGSSGGPFPLYGYSAGSWGSLSDDNFFGGGHITEFFWNSSDGNFYLLTDDSPSGTCFDTLTIDSTTLNRADASFDGSGWTWTGISNPVGTSGTRTITWR